MLQGRLCRCHVSNASHRWTSTTCYKNSKFELIRYYIILWRRTAFYMVNYVLPALLINIISLFVFMMPSESGEKITLGISAMLNMTVFLMAVVGELPPTDKTSIISKLFDTYCKTAANSTIKLTFQIVNISCSCGVQIPQ